MKLLKFISYTVLSLTFLNQSIIAMDPLEKEQAKINEQKSHGLVSTSLQRLNPRRLIICFDPMLQEADNKQFIVTATLVDALKSKSAPIIVGIGLWDYLVKESQYTANTQSSILLKRLWKSLDFKKEDWCVYRTLDETRAKGRGSVDTTFGKYAPDAYVLLFIPKEGKFKEYIEKIMPVESKDDISEGELLLGIKTHNLVPIPNPLAPKLVNSHSPDLAAYLDNILISKQDEARLKQNEEPLSWDIYLVGHGSSATSKKPEVAEMDPDTFSKFLSFLNNKINTRTLFYNSCYAGSNLKLPYQDPQEKQKETKNKSFNFTIISSTIFDLPATGSINIPTLEGDFVSFRATPEPQKEISVDFARYFNELAAYNIKSDPKSKLASITQLLNPAYLSYEDSNIIMQIPAIRYPHQEWFSALDLDTKLFRLNKMLILRTFDKPADQRFIEVPADVRIVLLEEKYIPVSLVIKGKQMPLLMPIDIGDSYFFKEIRAENIDLVGYAMNREFTGYDLINMLALLKKKTRNDLNKNIFFIESLYMTLKEKNNLNWGGDETKTLNFTNVVINPSKFISMTHNNKIGTFDLNENKWKEGSSSSINFQEGEKAIQQQSSIPETFEEQKISSQDLFKNYELYKDDTSELEKWKKSLSEQDKKKLDLYIKFKKQGIE